MAIIVKICGLSEEATIDTALDSGVDMIGLVLFQNSPRFVRPERARELARRVRGRAEVVILTVDSSAEALRRNVEMIDPDWLQLHGRESPETARELHDALGVKVMKALPVAERADLGRAEAFAGAVDRLLFDARPPDGAGRPGGHGRAFDWTLLRGLDPGLPFMLSGGLNAGNVADAIVTAGPAGVDVSSGVETAPGRKDPALIRAFIAAARKAESRSTALPMAEAAR